MKLAKLIILTHTQRPGTIFTYIFYFWSWPYLKLAKLMIWTLAQRSGTIFKTFGLWFSIFVVIKNYQKIDFLLLSKVKYRSATQIWKMWALILSVKNISMLTKRKKDSHKEEKAKIISIVKWWINLTLLLDQQINFWDIGMIREI